MDKLKKIKKKVEDIKSKIEKIEEAQQYQDVERFEFFKRDLEVLFTTIELSIFCCEMAINRTLELYNISFITECDGFIEQEVKRTNNEVNKVIREVKKTVEKAIQ